MQNLGGRFDALLLDNDGVLVASLDLVEEGFGRWARMLGVDPAEVSRVVTGHRLADVVTQFVSPSQAEWAMTKFEEIEVEIAAATRPCPGAVKLVKSLRGARWAIVTSAQKAVCEARLRACGLTLPPVLVAAEDVERGKPAPDGYLLAAQRLGVDPARCLAIDDSVVGVVAAKAAGATTWLLSATRHQEHDGIRALDDLTVVVDGTEVVVGVS